MFKKAALVLFVSGSLASTGFAANSTHANFQHRSSSRVSLDMSGGIITTSGNYGGNFLLSSTVQVDKTMPVRLGLTTGFMFGSGTGLPILASILFRLSETGARPYVGGAIGPVIGLAGGGSFGAGGGFHDVKLAILVRSGLIFKATDALDLTTEIAMGGLTGAFYVAPSVGMAINL